MIFRAVVAIEERKTGDGIEARAYLVNARDRDAAFKLAETQADEDTPPSECVRILALHVDRRAWAIREPQELGGKVSHATR